jgi:hypothetical protein
MPTIQHSESDIQVMQFLARCFTNRHNTPMEWSDIVTMDVSIVIESPVLDGFGNLRNPRNKDSRVIEVKLQMRNGDLVDWNLSEQETKLYKDLKSSLSFRSDPFAMHNIELTQHPIFPADIIPSRKGSSSCNYAYKCKACSGKDSFFCKKIADGSFNSVPKWWNICGPTKIPPSIDEFAISIPVFGLVLHRMIFQYVDIPSWDDKINKQLVVRPRPWHNQDITMFYQADRESTQNVLGDHLVLLENSVILDDSGLAELKRIISISKGSGSGTPLACLSKGHNYGTTQKELAWLKKADGYSDLELRAAASAFCLLTYKMCYTCYTNHDPIFSLVEL